MYDNLELTITEKECPDINFIEYVPPFLNSQLSYFENQYGAYITGYLDNLKVSISEKRVKITESSLCKYYLGDNFKTLSKGDTKRAIEKISDILHLPFEKSNITRIDFAKNLIMQYDEKIYYPYLGESQYYNRLPQNNGLYYSNSMKQLVFYGKVHEQKLKKQPIPELYTNRNVLRFEMRYTKRLREQLKQPQITGKLLSDEKFYNSLVSNWRNEYNNIQKINSKCINMKPTGSTKELIENMALFQLLEVGQPNILSTIKEWQERGLITKKQANDHRAKIKLLSKTPNNSNGNELINELNKKIKEASIFW